MRFGILIVFIALVIALVLFLGKDRQANPVAQGMAALEKAKARLSEAQKTSKAGV